MGAEDSVEYFSDIDTLRHELSLAAESLYRPLPYHNFEHAAVDTVEEVLRLAEACEANGLVINRRRLLAGAIMHDSRFYEPLTGSGFRSKEERSCGDARRLLPGFGFSDAEIDAVVEDISSTEAGVFCNSLHARILVRADIKNLRENKLVFLSNSLKLYDEHLLLHQEADTQPLNWREFVLKQQEILDIYLSQDLSLGDFDRDETGECLFTKAARLNVRELSSETITNVNAFVKKFGAQLLMLAPIISKGGSTNPIASE